VADDKKDSRFVVLLPDHSELSVKAVAKIPVLGKLKIYKTLKRTVEIKSSGTVLMAS
jgi:hypothetical protein